MSEHAPAAAKSSASPKPDDFHPYPFYTPRFWHGMRTAPYWKLLRDGHFKIQPSRLAMAAIISGIAPINDVMAAGHRLVHGRRIDNTELAGPPVFIVGHWRSGTTLLHELMVLDDQWTFPTSFQCFAPHHFLFTEWQFNMFGSWLLPSKRPMDNMSAGWRLPQEDEFALLVLGLPSPYRRMAFPGQAPPDMNYLDWTNISPEEHRTWVNGLRGFLKALTYKTPKPLVLKSPTHTGRIAVLAEAFPDAKFIHITRDPRNIFPSTCRLWKSLDVSQCFQRPNYDHLEEYVLECHERMYRAFHAGRSAVAEDQIIDIRYEDLVADPVAQLGHVYEKLNLGDFDGKLKPQLQDWVESQHRSYRTNKHSLPPEQEAVLKERWSEYFERYGYL
ncbi:sulfotransferase family protein [Rosistilla oblonga]|uniref:sulfotransferase family protein n=2 Tax=Rosistilla oblonga TaxID=2527990 RepID=UPI003A97FA00